MRVHHLLRLQDMAFSWHFPTETRVKLVQLDLVSDDWVPLGESSRQVDALKQRKSDLARKVDFEQVGNTVKRHVFR